uniref:Leucine-rich repeat-containing protein 16A-like n=1 Tax=Stegastes partitus TaxID=144197 RepID=A0A3B4ZFV6_9TELE
MPPLSSNPSVNKMWEREINSVYLHNLCLQVEHSFSYLDIQGISSNKPTQLVLEYERGPWCLRLGSAEEVDEVIAHIGSCLHQICPASSPVMRKLSLKPPDRTAALQAIWDEQGSADLGPCGGFSHQYWCVCDYLGLPYREEVQWDVDTIYLTQDTRELNLQDFVHLENRDLVPIIAALEYNQWFTKLSTKDYKLSTDVCDQIFKVVARSNRLEELVLDNAGLRSDFAQKLASALSHNPASTLHTINLSNNSLEDKGVSALSAQISKLPMGLKHLNLSRTSMSPKGVNSLCQALCANPVVASTLTHLDLSGNSLRGDDLQVRVCASLLRGSLKHLSVLNMSKTVFSHRKCKEIPPSFKQFFSCAQALTAVSLSGTRLPLEFLNILVDAVLTQILIIYVSVLPHSGLDMDLTTLLVWLAKNRSIRHLSLGKNFNNIKSKNVAQVLDNLVHMIQEEESPLTSLSLADSKLKSDLSIILNALGSNTSLTKLDISGNSMGDMGAKMLAKALQINTKLRTLVWDRNNVSPQGLQDVAAALEKNYTIRFMPVPIMDAAQALKANPEKTEDALLKVSNPLFVCTNLANKVDTDSDIKSTVNIKISSPVSCWRLSAAPRSLFQSLYFSAFCFVFQLLPNLYHLRSGGSRGACVGAIQDKLESMAGEVARVMDEQLQTMLVSMVDAAEGLCPHVMKRSSLRQELLKAGVGRMTIPRSFVTTTLLEQSGVDIINKISEVKLSIASFLSDRIADEILESLSGSQHTLADHLIRKDQPLVRQEPQMETEVLDETVLQPENHDQDQKLDRKHSLEDMDSCTMTPKSKRKSILVRMLRPVSVAFEMEFDLDKALEEVPIHVEDPPLPPPPLPSAEHKMLEHRTKFRPKPKKRTKPTRSPVGQETEQNSVMGKLDEGLDDFFSKKVIKLSFKLPSVKGSSSSTQEATDKKRESRKSGFFNLIKSRASRSEKSHGTTSATAAEPAEEEKEEKLKKENPHIPRHIGVPVMGMDLLAEMKARQERRAGKKVCGFMSVNLYNIPTVPDCVHSMTSILIKAPFLSVFSMSHHHYWTRWTVTKVLGTFDINCRANREARLSLFQKFRLCDFKNKSISCLFGICVSDDSPEAPTGGSSPKGPLPAPRLKRAPSDQERESTSSNPTGPLSPLDGAYPLRLIFSTRTVAAVVQSYICTSLEYFP